MELVVDQTRYGLLVYPERRLPWVPRGGALFEAMEFSNGRILNSRLSKYRVPRFSHVPAIGTVLLDRKDLPWAGTGGTPSTGVAPAFGTAIFHATGTRLRSLPMTPRGFAQLL
jgi:CO/xanthine dehydrogenase Mo-binding subunit